MTKTDRAKLVYFIFNNIGGGLFATSDPVESLAFGSTYRFQLSKLNAKRADMFNRIRLKLGEFSNEALFENFASDGAPVTDVAREITSAFRREKRDIFDKLDVWLAAPLFQTSELADFEHWGRSAFLKLDEAVWLSVGLEPKERFIQAIMAEKFDGSVNSIEVREYMNRHRELFRRKWDPRNFGDHPDLKAMGDWINEIGLDVHSGFKTLLEKPQQAPVKQVHSIQSPSSESSMDARERASMSKLIAAMAIDGYGYDPKARRSTIPNEIQGIANRLGLELSSKTILKYLTKGAELIPEDWEPE